MRLVLRVQPQTCMQSGVLPVKSSPENLPPMRVVGYSSLLLLKSLFITFIHQSSQKIITEMRDETIAVEDEGMKEELKYTRGLWYYYCMALQDRYCMNKWSPQARQHCFELFIDGGFTKMEISKMTGIPYRTVTMFSKVDHWKDIKQKRFEALQTRYATIQEKIVEKAVPKIIVKNLDLSDDVQLALRKKMRTIHKRLDAGADVDTMELKDVSVVLKNTSEVERKVTGMDKPKKVEHEQSAGNTFIGRLFQFGVSPIGRSKAGAPKTIPAEVVQTESAEPDF